MSPSRNSIATDATLLIAALCVATGAAAANPAGFVAKASGPVFAQGAGGHAKILAEGSAVAAGDTIVAGKDTFVELRFADEGVVVLGPDTELAIDAFAFDAARPLGDRAEFTLAHGALKVTSGAIAKREGDLQKLKTPLGTIGVRGTFIVTYSPPDPATLASWAPVRLAALSPAITGTLSDASPLQVAQLTPPSAPKAAGLPPGLYVSVIDGAINLSNKGGSQNFSAGQFGYTASITQLPVVVPKNPGIQFTPPPTFNASSTPGSSTASPKSNTVDCEVR